MQVKGLLPVIIVDQLSLGKFMAARACIRHAGLRCSSLPKWRAIRLWNMGSSCSISVSSLSLSGKGKASPLQERRMVDRFSLHVRGGEGGSGCTSFRKSRHSRHGFADGGNGGSGGSVILVSSAAVWDFSNLQHHLNAKKGCQGTSKRRIGSRGADKIVQVPIGTVVRLVEGSVPSLEPPSLIPDQLMRSELGSATSRDASGSSRLGADLGSVTAEDRVAELSRELQGLGAEDITGDEAGISSDMDGLSDDVESVESPSEAVSLVMNDDNGAEDLPSNEGRIMSSQNEIFVVEFVKAGQSFVVACGGDGGRGNASMSRGRGAAKSLPSLEHEPGHPGSEAVLMLELKTLADVGLVGMPNAGKSTLLGALSRAKPAVGHYAFTTLRPNIGKLEFDDFFSLTVADIPGLIEGAHQNRGLGHDFLRHIERTKALAYVVDLAGGLGENKGLLAWEQLSELMFELEQYQAGLSRRPSIVVANKIDEDGAQGALEELQKRVPTFRVFPVCAVLGDGIGALKEGLRGLLDEYPATSLDETTNLQKGT